MKRVLFLCSANMARSIMAEAILRKEGGGQFEAYSAGAEAAGMISPFAIESLQNRGYPTDGLSSKDWDIYSGDEAPDFDFVISLCSQARAAIQPLWEGGGEWIHWPVTDPIRVEGNQTRMRASFDDVCDAIIGNVCEFIADH